MEGSRSDASFSCWPTLMKCSIFLFTTILHSYFTQTHTVTHTHTRSHTHTSYQAHTHVFSNTLSLSLTHTNSHAHKRTYSHFLTHIFTHSLSHSQTVGAGGCHTHNPERVPKRRALGPLREAGGCQCTAGFIDFAVCAGVCVCVCVCVCVYVCVCV